MIDNIFIFFLRKYEPVPLQEQAINGDASKDNVKY